MQRICHKDLVVKAAAKVKIAALEQGFKKSKKYSGLTDSGYKFTVDVLGSIPIYQHKNRYAPAGRIYQRIPNHLAGFITVKNICLQVNGILCVLNKLQQQVKIFLAAPYQPHVVLAGEFF